MNRFWCSHFFVENAKQGSAQVRVRIGARDGIFFELQAISYKLEAPERESNMRAGIAVWALLVGLGTTGQDAKRFDGIWDTVLSCPNDAGAMGYAFRFASVVKDGSLHGDKGTKGQPGWLEINGRIAPDGVSHLLANGLVGASEYAVGKRPAGTEYAYKIDAMFGEGDGKGKRVEGRPCEVTFVRAKRVGEGK